MGENNREGRINSAAEWSMKRKTKEGRAKRQNLPSLSAFSYSIISSNPFVFVRSLRFDRSICHITSDP